MSALIPERSRMKSVEAAELDVVVAPALDETTKFWTVVVESVILEEPSMLSIVPGGPRTASVKGAAVGASDVV